MIGPSPDRSTFCSCGKNDVYHDQSLICYRKELFMRDRTQHLLFRLVLMTLIVLFSARHPAFGQTTFFTRIPSTAGGETGILLFVKVPGVARYITGAPVAVYQVGGFQSTGIGEKDGDLDTEGFIEIAFNYPGNDDPALQSGGIYDHRGVLSLRAVCDVLLYAMGARTDIDGQSLSDLTAPIVPLAENVGLIGYSNSGNTNICVAGIHGAELGQLAWILNWEAPVGDGMPQAEAGAKQEGILRPLNAETNPAYNPDMGIWTLDDLSYAPGIRLPVLGMTDSSVYGGLYFDFDGDETVDPGEDFIPYPLVFDTDSGRVAYYSERLRRHAAIHNLLPEIVPDHIPSVAETESFWAIRNGAYWIVPALAHIPSLMFMVACSEIDHVQRALDHPHILIQYEMFRNAGARFVRVNPDRAYMEDILGNPAPLAVDNPAFAPFDHFSIRTTVEPGCYTDSLGSRTNVPAGACELADRTYWNDLSPQIGSVITSVAPEIGYGENGIELLCHPNPFNHETIIEFVINRSGRIRLAVYNVRGRRIAVLEDGFYRAGMHRTLWRANGLPTGVYILHLTTDGTDLSRKVHLVR